ncbi:hypothetical protein Tco_1272889 [Tanacetum coccineum]
MQGTSYDSNTGKCVQDIREDTIRLSRKTNFREAHNNAKRKWAHTRNVKAKATQDSLLQGQDATNKQAQGSESSNGLRTVVDSCRGTGYRTLKLSDNSPTMFMANLTSENPIYDEAGPSYDSNNPFEVQDHDTFVDHLDEYHEVHEMQKTMYKTQLQHFVGVQTALFKEVKEMEEIFDQMNNEVDKNTVDKQCAEIEKKNLLIENENLIVNCLSTQLLQNDVYQHLQESFDNKNSQASQEAPDFNSFFKIKNLEHQIQEKDNVIRHLKDLVANVNDRSREPYNAIDVTALIEQNDCDRVELEKVKQHYKELYDSIKITRAHTSEKTSTMLNEIESLKAQLRSKEPCFTSEYVKPKVFAPGMYVIDVKSIPHPLKNNRSAHLNYVNHLKESVETVREIVEELIVEKAIKYRDKPGTSSSNTQKHESGNPKAKLLINKFIQDQAIRKPKANCPDNSLYTRPKWVGKLRKTMLQILVYHGEPTRKKLTLGKLDCDGPGHALVSYRRCSNNIWESFKAHGICGTVHRVSQHSGNDPLELSLVIEIMVMGTV